MAMFPTPFDLWLARELAGFLRFHPRFDLGVQSAIQHNILGGLWFGAALFICWIQSARNGQREIQLRMLTILIGSILATLLTLLAGALISWPPPARYPGLANLFPSYLEANPNTNCFPSQSTALYGSIAAGVYSLHKASGWVLWVLVAVCVALPRMYVGGHFMTDILASLLLALVGYASARRLLEARVTSKIEPFLEKRPRLQFLREFLVFIWILQVAVGFRDVVWLKRVVELIISGADRL
jgi:membrane-associated phospholipid phosphatase